MTPGEPNTKRNYSRSMLQSGGNRSIHIFDCRGFLDLRFAGCGFEPRIGAENH